MTRFILTILLLTLFSLSAFAQSFIAVGPTLGATTSNGFPGGSQTQAGVNITGQYSFRIASLEFGMGGSMGIVNQPRFFDEGDGAVFQVQPIGRMYVPVSDAWSLYFDGGVDMQRIAAIDTTTVNPVAGFGLRRMSRTGAGELNHSIEFGYKCLFDDINNDAMPLTKVWRGYAFNGQVYKKLTPSFGFLFGGRLDRQSNSVLTAPRTQATFSVGLALGPR